MADSALVDLAKVSVSVDDVDVAAFISFTASAKFSMWSNAYSLICEVRKVSFTFKILLIVMKAN